MSSLKRVFGIDGVDLAIHAGVTGFLMMLVDEAAGNDALIAAVGALSLVVFGLRRHRALRQMGADVAGELPAARLAEIDARLDDADHLQIRVQELEERLDFAERLLAQAREPERLS
jgi:hypothetical protein